MWTTVLVRTVHCDVCKKRYGQVVEKLKNEVCEEQFTDTCPYCGHTRWTGFRYKCNNTPIVKYER